jgi:hypothetical protein
VGRGRAARPATLRAQSMRPRVMVRVCRVSRAHVMSSRAEISAYQPNPARVSTVPPRMDLSQNCAARAACSGEASPSPQAPARLGGFGWWPIRDSPDAHRAVRRQGR